MAVATSRPVRALVVLAVAIVAIFAGIAGTVAAGEPKGSWRPKLGLDLEGGTSITLLPRSSDQSKVTDENIAQAVEVIRRRVDSFGVSEAEVSSQGTGGSRSILISVPGRQGGNILDLVRQTAELRFRRVLQAGPAGPAAPDPQQSPGAAPSGTATGTGNASGPATPKPSSTAKPKATTSPAATVAPQPSSTSAGRVVPTALLAAPAPSSPPAASSGPAASGGSGPAAPEPSGVVPSDVDASGVPQPQAPGAEQAAGQVTPELQQRFDALDCTKPESRKGGGDDPNVPIVACDREGTAKYILGKAEVLGTDVKGATAGLETNSQGQAVPGSWEVNLEFTGDGTRKWADLTTATVQEQVAIVLDGLVVSAPTIQEPIRGGQARISGRFTQQDATDLANVLKYGALPLTFEPGTAQEISPTLGAEQLRAGVLAGGIGLLLVVLYSLLYYRGLGLVNVASLIVSAILTYGAVVLFGNVIGLRLSLAGVAGFIVGIGIAADSFIVYFERLRDEVRDGKTLRVAVETGWRRARRTVLAADFVSFLAAVVLYVLSVGAVRGFAFTLGLTTVIDVIVVFLFTKPLVTLLARTKFFGGGHKWSGLSPERLGAGTRAMRPAGTRARPAPVATRSARASARSTQEA